MGKNSTYASAETGIVSGLLELHREPIARLR
jgi:hypothetical protein